MRTALLQITIALALATPWSVSAGTESFKLDASNTAIRFEIRHMLGNVSGRFKTVSGVLRLNPQYPDDASVVATVEAGSIDTGNRTRDAHLKQELFAAATYPDIIFKSRRVERVAADRAELIGELTMHGVTKPLVLHVQRLPTSTTAGGDAAHWHVTGTLKRSAFGLVWSKSVEAISMIGDDVVIEIESESAD
jgi:polyisoprenoid-binding protein YceI